MGKVNLAGLVLSGLVVLGCAAVTDAADVDFDRGGVCAQFQRQIQDVDSSGIQFVPVPAEKKGRHYLRRVGISEIDRKLVAGKLSDTAKEKELLGNSNILMFFDGEKVTFAESLGEERYNMVLQSQDLYLLSWLKGARYAEAAQDRGYVQFCIEVVRWAIFIKDGIETGEWVYETVCKMQWEPGPGEYGHIPPGSENHARSK